MSRSYAWHQIERMGWQNGGWWGDTLQVFPRGGPFDVPGPHSSVGVGRIWRPARRRVADPMPELLERQGITSLRDR